MFRLALQHVDMWTGVHSESARNDPKHDYLRRSQRFETRSCLVFCDSGVDRCPHVHVSTAKKGC